MEGYRMKSVGALGGTEEDTEEDTLYLIYVPYTEGGRVRADGLIIFTSESLEVVVTTPSLHSGGPAFEIYNRLTQRSTNFPKSMRHVKILEVRRLTQSKSLTDSPHILVATLKNSVAQATSRHRFVHPVNLIESFRNTPP
jgi:hypothetical protein